jgi:hypothetical protein
MALPLKDVFRGFMAIEGAVKDLTQLVAKTADEFAIAQLQETIVESKECRRVTPIDTGTLRASVRAKGPVREGRIVKTWIVAGEQGSGAEAYALIVHEDPDAHHPIGAWKYIEHPLKESAPYMAQRIAKRVDLNRAKKGGSAGGGGATAGGEGGAAGGGATEGGD